MNLKLCVAGVLLSASSMWVGAYVMIAVLPKDHWTVLPALCSFGALFFAGVILVSLGTGSSE